MQKFFNNEAAPDRRAREIFRREGGRWTRPRAAVLQAFLEARRPLTPAEIRRRPSGRSVDLVTVYRAVRRFSRQGILVPVAHRPGAQAYDLAEEYRGHRHRLVCQDCDGVEEVQGCFVESSASRALERKGFSAARHELTFFGKCRRCR
jgi:Fur family ferric uptake transcriptional regulator